MKKVDLEGINDEIVEAVIVQLQNTGNRPHLVKELAAILMQQLKIVQQYVLPLPPRCSPEYLTNILSGLRTLAQSSHPDSPPTSSDHAGLH